MIDIVVLLLAWLAAYAVDRLDRDGNGKRKKSPLIAVAMTLIMVVAFGFIAVHSGASQLLVVLVPGLLLILVLYMRKRR